MSDHPINLTVNGMVYQLTVRAHHTLLDILRDDLGLPGTNEGCRMGDCGACTVLLNDRRVPACLVLAPRANGKTVLTIEGLAETGRLHPLQDAFIRHGALQCGFCTPGMILTAKAFLAGNGNPKEEEVRRAISGNLCRCTGYQKIVEAIQLAAEDGS